MDKTFIRSQIIILIGLASILLIGLALDLVRGYQAAKRKMRSVSKEALIDAITKQSVLSCTFYRDEQLLQAATVLQQEGLELCIETIDEALLKALVRQDVPLYVEESLALTNWPRTKGTFFWIVGMCFIVQSVYLGSLYFFARQGTEFYGASEAQQIGEMTSHTQIRFKDVAGLGEELVELKEVVSFLKSPEKFQALGAKIPKGILLYGPPGTGKTLLAKAIAGEAGVSFLEVAGSEFVEVFLGLGAKRVRSLFKKAAENAPCIIFIDEIDAVGSSRAQSANNLESTATLNQLLVEMDGFSQSKNILVIAATNRKKDLDEALLRPGRFDRKILVGLPDRIAREEILALYLGKVKTEPTVSAEEFAKLTTGFSGAELRNLVNEAAIFAVRRDSDTLSFEDMSHALDKLRYGIAKPQGYLREVERNATAYRLAAEAVAAAQYAEAELELNRISLIGTNLKAPGQVVYVEPENFHFRLTNAGLKARAIVWQSAIEAERFFLGPLNVTTGIAKNLELTINAFRNAIEMGGFEERLAKLSYAKPYANNPWLYHLSSSEQRIQDIWSDETRASIDEYIEAAIETAQKEAHAFIIKNQKLIEYIKCALVEKEHLSGKEVLELITKFALLSDENKNAPIQETTTFVPVSEAAGNERM